jgi:hypothetical protein
MDTKVHETGLVVSAAQIKERMLALYSPGRKGFEDPTKKEDFIIPRVKLLQGLSPEVQASPRDFYAGMIIDSLTKAVLPAKFVPVFKTMSWARFNPRDPKDVNFNSEFAAGDLVWRSVDPNDPRVIEETKWGPRNEKPLATAFMNYLCYFEGVTMPLVLSFSRSSYPVGKELYNLALRAEGDMFSQKYELGAKKVEANSNSWYVFTVRPLGVCTADELEVGSLIYDKFFETRDTMKVDEETREPGSEG